MTKTLPLQRVATAFAADAVPFTAVLQVWEELKAGGRPPAEPQRRAQEAYMKAPSPLPPANA